MTRLYKRLGVMMAVACFGLAVSAPGSRAAAFWFDHHQTVTLTPGDVFSFHVSDIDRRHIRSWKTINWLTAGNAIIHQKATGTLHLDPGQTYVMDGYSNLPFQDKETFTNIGSQTQDLAGAVQEDSLPPVPIGPTPVDPGDSAMVGLDVDVADFDGQYRFTKTVLNQQAFRNWWGVENENWWNDFAFVAGGAFSDHHFFDRLLLKDEWFFVTNAGAHNIEFDFRMELHAVPLPASGVLLAAGLAVLGWRGRRRRH